MKFSSTLILAVLISLGSASASYADHVVFLGDVVDRSTIAVVSKNDGGKLMFEITWGPGIMARVAKVKYNESYGSAEARNALSKLASLLRSDRNFEFDDPDLTTKIGLTPRK